MKGNLFSDLRKLLELQSAQTVKAVEKIGVKPMREILEGARKKLRAELAELSRAGKDETYSAHHRRTMLLQVEAGIADMTKAMTGKLNDASAILAKRGLDHLADEVALYGNKFSVQHVLPVRTASTFAGAEKERGTLLRRLSRVDPETLEVVTYKNKSSIARYGLEVIDAMERRMTLGLLTGESVAGLAEGLMGIDGVFEGQKWKAERIARTELMNAYGADRQAAISDVAQDIPGAGKMWVAISEDDRTCEQCEEAHGQTRKADEPFDVGGKEVMKPPAHPNCRCVSVLTINPEE